MNVQTKLLNFSNLLFSPIRMTIELLFIDISYMGCTEQYFTDYELPSRTYGVYDNNVRL